MLLLKHNALSVEDLFTIERQLLRWLDNKETDIGLDFNVLNLKRVDIYGHLLGIFTRLGCLDTLQITPSELLDFLIDVDTAYLNAPYHSFYHAVDIVFVIYFILTKLEAIHYFNHLHVSAILIAGLCHDIGHPGYNNVYQVNFKTELATKYNNESVLEAYSSDLTKSLLLEKHVNFVNGMSIEIKNQWIEQIEKLILQTDMKYHFTLQEQAGLLEEIIYQQCVEHNFMKGYDTPNTNSSTPLKHQSNDYLVEENHETDYFNLLIPPSSPPSEYLITTTTPSQFKNYQTLPPQWVVPNVTLSPSCFFNTSTHNESNITDHHQGNTKMTSSLSNDTTIFQPTFNEEQCLQFLSILLHAADISNTVRPWFLSKQWSDLIVQEFFRQGDYEKLAGFDVSPGMNRDVNNQPDISLTFGDLLVRPYFEALTNLLPDAYIFLDILENNRDEWLNLKLKNQEQEKPSSQQHLPTKLNNKRLSVIQYPNGHPYNDQQQQQHMQERQFPNGLLPIPKSSLSDQSNTIKNERRVSVAAGTISIPDDLDLSGKSNKYKGRRGQSGLRSYSLVTDRVDIFRKFSYVPPPRNHRSSTLPVIHKRMSLHPQSSALATSSPLTSTISNHSNHSNNNNNSKTSTSSTSYFSLLFNFLRNHITIYILLYILLFIILYVLLKN